MKSGDVIHISGEEILAEATNLPGNTKSMIVIYDGDQNEYVVLLRELPYRATVIRRFPVGERLPRLVYRDALLGMARMATEDVYLEDQPPAGYGHGV